MTETTLQLDDQQLRLLMALLLEDDQQEEDEQDTSELSDPDIMAAAMARSMDPLMAEIFAQAESQRGVLRYQIVLIQEHADRVWEVLGEALNLAIEEGDLFAAAELEGLIGLFNRLS